MADTGRRARTRRAGRSIASASHAAGRAGAATANGAGRIVHRLSRASGAGQTGLSNLIELTAAGGVGDAFVAVALAGTLFFSTSVDQARGRIALALLITMAPFAVLAPFLGPMLDRVQQGRRYILMGTLLARGLLCWGMAGAVAHNDGVTRAAVTPRLLPSEITLVTANARSALGGLIASTLGAGLAVGVSFAAGGGSGGAAWVLRAGTAIYLAATALALRLPSGVDTPLEPAAPWPGSAATAPQGSRADPRLADTMPLATWAPQADGEPDADPPG